MSRRSPDEAETYRANRQHRLSIAGDRCEARWHPSCPELADDRPAGPYLVTHHVTRRRDGGTDDWQNLRIVCEWCHNRIHARPDEATARRLLKPRGAE